MKYLSTKSLSTNYARGMAAEIYAIVYLFFKGYRIRAWRYKTPVGEVDVVAERNKKLVFVEVKLRPHLDGALESITPQMKSRISRAAAYYLSQKAGARAGEWQGEMRFDVIAVSGWRLRHLDNAWFPPT